jgi:molybdopterin converting factor small subunit
MTILVKFFGDLAKRLSQNKEGIKNPLDLEIESEGIEYVEDILNKYSIEKDETSHIFVNGTYSGFKKKIKDGDRIGIFPRNMGLLYKWYFTRHEDE